MHFIAVRDLREKSAQIWKKLSKEKELVITSNGKPIAILEATNEDCLETSLALVRRVRAMMAVETMQEQSNRSKRGTIGLQQINKEIKSVRKSRKVRRK